MSLCKKYPNSIRELRNMVQDFVLFSDAWVFVPEIYTTVMQEQNKAKE